MLLREYSYNLVNIVCMPNSTELNAVVDLGGDVSEVMPYINSVVRNCTYNHEHKILDFMHDEHIVTIESRRMKVTGLSDDDHARKVIDDIKDLINETWEKRDSIEPIYENIRPATPLEILKLLPQSNCRECGEPTCLSFALRVVNEDKTIDQCTELEKPEWAHQAEQLKKLLYGRRGVKK